MTLPNQLTLLRILLTPVFMALFFGTGPAPLLAFVVFTVASVTDWYDGYAARKFGFVSSWGRFMDPLADKILISAGFLCFCILGYFPAWILAVIILRDAVITALRGYSMNKEKPLITSLLAKSKTFVQFVVLYFIFIYHLTVFYGLAEKIPGVIRFIERIRLIPALMVSVMILTLASGSLYLMGNRIHLKRLWISIWKKTVPSDM